MKKLLTAAFISATTIALLAGCTDSNPKQMPTAAPTITSAPTATKAPSDLLPKDEATKTSAKLLGTTTLRKGVVVKTYSVGTGTLVAEQLKSNPTLAAAGAKLGDKVVVVRYTITNNSGSTVPVVSFAYNGVFVGGDGKSAAMDSGFASATTRLGYASTPVAQFADKKGKSGNWQLKNGDSADWYTDWVLESKGVLSQNFIFEGKVVSNVRLNLV
jgi:hypothetical protein